MKQAALHSLLKAQIVMLIPLRSKYCSYQTMITRRSSIIKWNIFAKEKETALLYGEKLLGTLCDVLSITDENGNDLLQQYKVSVERNAASLTYEFVIDLPSGKKIHDVNIAFAFGVNEDLSSHFSMSDSTMLNISLLE